MGGGHHLAVIGKMWTSPRKYQVCEWPRRRRMESCRFGEAVGWKSPSKTKKVMSSCALWVPPHSQLRFIPKSLPMEGCNLMTPHGCLWRVYIGLTLYLDVLEGEQVWSTDGLSHSWVLTGEKVKTKLTVCVTFWGCIRAGKWMRTIENLYCNCNYIYIHIYIHSFIHTFMHSFIHTYIHTYLHLYIHT